jgi:hypothetical protein
MSKRENHKGKFSHYKDGDRSKHWKHGKSSGKSDTKK